MKTKIVLIAACLFGMIVQLHAVPITWTGAKDANFFDKANWMPMQVPTMADDVTIPDGSTVEANGLVIVKSLDMKNGAAGTTFTSSGNFPIEVCAFGNIFIGASVTVNSSDGTAIDPNGAPVGFFFTGDFTCNGVIFGGDGILDGNGGAVCIEPKKGFLSGNITVGMTGGIVSGEGSTPGLPIFNGGFGGNIKIVNNNPFTDIDLSGIIDAQDGGDGDFGGDGGTIFIEGFDIDIDECVIESGEGGKSDNPGAGGGNSGDIIITGSDIDIDDSVIDGNDGGDSDFFAGSGASIFITGTDVTVGSDSRIDAGDGGDGNPGSTGSGGPGGSSVIKGSNKVKVDGETGGGNGGFGQGGGDGGPGGNSELEGGNETELNGESNGGDGGDGKQPGKGGDHKVKTKKYTTGPNAKENPGKGGDRNSGTGPGGAGGKNIIDADDTVDNRNKEGGPAGANNCSNCAAQDGYVLITCNNNIITDFNDEIRGHYITFQVPPNGRINLQNLQQDALVANQIICMDAGGSGIIDLRGNPPGKIVMRAGFQINLFGQVLLSPGVNLADITDPPAQIVNQSCSAINVPVVSWWQMILIGIGVMFMALLSLKTLGKS